MTRVEFFDQDGRISGFCCSGHSGYAEAGSDIVCAAVSTAVKFAETTLSEVLGERVKTPTFVAITGSSAAIASRIDRGSPSR